MTTVIIPGAPRPQPGPVREVLPRPPSLTYSGMRTKAYRDWYNKYGTLTRYKSYKRTRRFTAGGARHGSGDDYRHYAEDDPIGTSFNDTFGYLGHVGSTWANSNSGPRIGTIIRSEDPDRKHYLGYTSGTNDYNKDIIWDGEKWTYYYDKHSSYHAHKSTAHFDQRDSRMRDTSPWARDGGKYAYAQYIGPHTRRGVERYWGYGKIINAGYGNVKRTKATKRTIRYRRFRPGFFKRDDHY